MLSKKTQWATALVICGAMIGMARGQQAEPQLEPIPLPQGELPPQPATAPSAPAAATTSPSLPQEAVDQASPSDTLVIEPPAVDPPDKLDSRRASNVTPAVPVTPPAVVTQRHYSAVPVSPRVIYRAAPPVAHATHTVYSTPRGRVVAVTHNVPGPPGSPGHVRVVETMRHYPGGTVYRAHSHAVPPGVFQRPVAVPPPVVVPVFVPGQPVRNAIRASRW